MSKKRFQSRLGWELALATVCAFVLACIFYMVTSRAAYRTLDKVLLKPETLKKQESNYIDRLQQYVTEENLSMYRQDELDQWMKDEKRFLVSLYLDGKILYSNNRQAIVPLENISDWNEEIENGFASNEYFITFSDGTVQAVLAYLYEPYYYSAAEAICMFLAFIIFVTILFLFIRRKMDYISLLEGELKILKGGDLDYSITIQGKDELALLAGEINSMRCAMKERQEKEEKATEANRNLITAMSHDLRTPLTSLIGYLDILNMDKLDEIQSQKRYLEAAQKKAYQIKNISDKLFEYFIVYGKEKEGLHLEQVHGAELIGQFVEESLFDLESNGFYVKRQFGEISCSLEIDVDLVRRMFGNIFSNLLKYADASMVIEVEYEQKEDILLICFSNYIDTTIAKKESSNIGLKTCERVMKEHGGSFKCRKENNIFHIMISFPTG